MSNPNPPTHQASSFPLNINDITLIREVIWDLIIQRVLTIGDYYNDSWPWLSLTVYGKMALNSDLPPPHDPLGHIE